MERKIDKLFSFFFSLSFVLAIIIYIIMGDEFFQGFVVILLICIYYKISENNKQE